MKTERSAHGFTAVDSQENPKAWIAVLDKCHREPFCISYRKRVAELLDPKRGGMYLDIGAGIGDDARHLAERNSVAAVAVDLSQTLMFEAAYRGLSTAVVGDALYLPFGDGIFDGCSAVRTFQHLSDPQGALKEAVRVLRSKGRLVVIDPDYDTQVMELPDQELARRVFRFRADVGLRNGTLAHRMSIMFADAGLHDIRVEPMTMILRDHTAHDNVMGLRSWARSAHKKGHLNDEDADRWEEMFDETVSRGRFMYAVTFYLTVGRKP